VQPRTAVKFDHASFDRVKRSVNAIAAAVRGRRDSAEYGAPLPLDVGVELTTRCNLRCKHCFLWNEEGLYEKTQGFVHMDLDYGILERVLRETAPAKSNLFFWGTEPLLYRHWDELSRAIERDERWTVICTNGTLLDKRMHCLLPISRNLAVVVSVDGLESTHEAIRGEGSFAQIMRNLDLLRLLKSHGEYRGQITLHTVLSERLIPELYEYCLFAESLEVDSLYIGFPWYISDATAKRMDRYVADRLGFLSLPVQSDCLRSWHTYRHRLDSTLIPLLREQLLKLSRRTWKPRFRLQPALEVDELEDFLAGGERPAQGRSECYAVSTRMDIRANGTVTACQCYPELVVGNLSHESLPDIWHGEKMRRMRRVVAHGLTPVCSKCILLYLNGK
jgi:MoaA/NifB/PqqE/SkfB family radical SAM enzyme